MKLLTTKLIIIMRGLPSSGKSFLSKKIVELYGVDNTEICSADHYFYKLGNGVYKFDRNKLGQAHKECREKCQRLCEAGKPIIIIDNTNITSKEYKDYITFANQYGYDYKFLIPKTAWAFDVDECFKRNQHGVPLETLTRMRDNWKESPNDLLFSFPDEFNA